VRSKNRLGVGLV